ncbi:MAG: glycosyltransferase [Chloroflexia bacterium]|nr:glycosyltransferase [Chloroflexia bacterium]
MVIILVQILFWLALLALLHTYLFYPLIVIFLARNKENNKNVYEFEELPEITIIMAVHNEEKVIAEKLESVVNSDYPKDRIAFLIGSDASTDKTNQIVDSYTEKFPYIKLQRFNERSGKIKIINALFDSALSPVLVMTDANAIFSKGALSELIKHFRNPKINVVGGRLFNRKSGKGGIAKQEHTYMESEFKVKIAEGKLWGTMMGAYGAFYAIRKESFVKVPENFMVDDFFISLKAIEKLEKRFVNQKPLHMKMFLAI